MCREQLHPHCDVRNSNEDLAAQVCGQQGVGDSVRGDEINISVVSSDDSFSMLCNARENNSVGNDSV